MKIKLMPMLLGVIALGAVVTPFAVNAQSNFSTRPLLAQTQQREGHQGKWQKLNLTQEQQDQMRQIKEETRAQMQTILTPEQQATLKAAKENRQANRQNPQGRRNMMADLNLSDTQKEQMRELMQQQKARIEALLTDTQKQQLEQMQQEWKQKRQQRQQGNQ